MIEAAPEDLELKRELFARLAEVVEPDCVLATNTSSLSVTALAAGLPHPARVVGMHFFNPPAKMRLVEVVAGEESSAHALTVAREAGEAMGKHVIDAADTPGLHRQPLQPPVRARGAAGRPGRARHARAGRPHLPHGRRLPDGPVRADGPRRARRRARRLALVLRAVVRRAALAAVAAGGEARGRRAPGPQERPRLVRVPAGPARRPRAGRRGRCGDVDELRAGRGRRGLAGASVLPPLGRLVEIDAATRRERGASASSPRSACTSSASATSCSRGSSPSSSTRRASRSARASARPPTSTPGWSSGSTTRAGRSPGAT